MTKKNVKEPNCIHLCFLWIYRLLFYTGCLGFRLISGEKLSLTRFTQIYTNIVRIALLMGFIGGFAVKLSNEESASAMLDELSPILKFIMTFECVTCSLTYMKVSLAMDWQKNAHIKLAEKFQNLDQRFKLDFPQISWNYHKSVRKYTSITLFITNYYIIVSILYIFNVTYCLCDMLTSFVIAISYAVLTSAPGTVAFLHIGTMDMLRLRYRLICRLLENMKTNAEYTRTSRSNTNKQQQAKAVHRLAIYCRRYTDLILQINIVFGYVAAAALFYDFGVLTCLVYLICQKVYEAKEPMKEYIFIILFMAPRMYKVLITSAYGQQMHKEKRRCIHDLCNSIDELKSSAEESLEMFRSFLHWKMLSNCDVTIGKTKPCGLNILFMVINGITNYVLILIQLQFQQSSITNSVRYRFNWRKTAK